MTWPLFNLLLRRNDGPGTQPLDLFLDFISERGLELYPAQEEAILELYSGKNVILNTPTGSGKSLVAAALHFQSLALGRQSIYTCPIKALANEKFLALCKDFGPDQVGMITGDATVNPNAPIICCTAEILSNFALRYGPDAPYHDIIIDEFHYYSDRDRGVAWQVPLLTLSKSRFLLMSATLGDTEFFEKNLTELNRLETVVVRSTNRPVPLNFKYSERPLYFQIQELIGSGLSPIYLVSFAQRECAEEAQNLLSVDFCTKEEKRKIAEELEGVNFRTPYGKELQRLLKHGVGLHHAGLLPRYRVLVEKLAQKGLLKVICGTDTLGVGVNVPIRTVLFTKLCKFDGQKTTILSVRDFQQISGRAGRKGFDDFGTVVVQAPEHVIENLGMVEKAAGDPKKAKKMVKKRPPDKGHLPWDKATMEKLATGRPEALVSRFQVTHAMILNVLSREGTRNCGALRDLIRNSHETENQKKHHRKLAFQLFRSLWERGIVNLSNLQVNVDLQHDFSLHQTLSLYLIDTLALLEREAEDYALDLLTLVEAILENPDLILRRQVDKMKKLRMEEMRAQGLEYEERLAELEKVEHPKPNRDFIYRTWNTFAAAHPWVGQDNIRPKSIVREMFENFLSFHDYIKEYGLERVEGLLLRYLSETYKVLVQTVPDSARNDEIDGIIDYLGGMLRDIDSSLVEEWEKLRDPSWVKPISEREDRLAIEEANRKLKKAQMIAIRNEVFRVLRFLGFGQYSEAAAMVGARTEELEASMEQFFSDHEGILLTPSARALNFSQIHELEDGVFSVNQTVVDPEGKNDWRILFEARLGKDHGERVVLSFLGLEEI
jgi:superfamily II RNA helicase